MKDHLIQFKVTLSNWKENTNEDEEATSKKKENGLIFWHMPSKIGTWYL